MNHCASYSLELLLNRVPRNLSISVDSLPWSYYAGAGVASVPWLIFIYYLDVEIEGSLRLRSRENE